jgi:hypothetical protein
VETRKRVPIENYRIAAAAVVVVVVAAAKENRAFTEYRVFTNSADNKCGINAALAANDTDGARAATNEAASRQEGEGRLARATEGDGGGRSKRARGYLGGNMTQTLMIAAVNLIQRSSDQ